MFDFLTAPENFPFAVVLTVMLGIAVLEVLSMMFGTALSGLVDSLLPDVDVDVAAPQALSLSLLLSWLRIGQPPAFRGRRMGGAFLRSATDACAHRLWAIRRVRLWRGVGRRYRRTGLKSVW